MRCNPIKSLTFNTTEPLTKPYVRNIIRVTTRQRRKISFEEFANLQALCHTKNQNEIQKFVQNKYGCPRCQCCCFTLKPQFESSISCNNRPSVLQLENSNQEQSEAFFPVSTNNLHTPNPSSQVKSDPTSTSVTDKTKPSSSYHGAPKAEAKSSAIPADRSARQYDSSTTETPHWLIAAANALFSQGSEKPGVAIPDTTLKDQIFQSLENHRSILIPLLSFLLFILFCLLVLSLGLPLHGSNENEYPSKNSASLMNARSTDKSNPHLSTPTNQNNQNLPDYYKNTKGSGSTDSDSKVNAGKERPETDTEEYGKLPLQLDPSKLSHTGSSMYYRTEDPLQQVDDSTEDSQTSSRANTRMSPENRNQNNAARSQASLRKYISSAAVALFGSNTGRTFAETSTSNSDEDCTSKCSCETGHCVYSKFY